MRTSARIEACSAIAALILLCGPAAAGAADLIDSLKRGDRAAVRAALAATPAADVNAQAADGTTALHYAVNAGDLELTRLLLQAGARVNVVSRYGVSPIALAAGKGKPRIVEWLLEAGANPDAANADGQTALMTAARSGDVATARALIEWGAEVDARERWFQQTALMWAAAQGHAAVVTALCDAGADVNARAAVIERYKTPQSGVQTSPRGGLTPLLYAARQGLSASAAALADCGANLNLADPDGISPLVMAIINGHYDAAQLLIDRGADVNLADRTGRGPLFVAVDMHTLESRFNRPNPRLRGQRGSVDIVKSLLAHGADVHAQLTANILPPKTNAPGNPNLTAGSTPFLKASTTADVELMALLLDWGADPFAVNAAQTNAVMMAAGLNWRILGSIGTQQEAIAAITLLLERGLDLNARNDTGQTALHGAVMRGDEGTELLRFLIARGADVHAQTKAGQTALDLTRGGVMGQGNNRPPNVAAAALLTQAMNQPKDGR